MRKIIFALLAVFFLLSALSAQQVQSSSNPCGQFLGPGPNSPVPTGYCGIVKSLPWFAIQGKGEVVTTFNPRTGQVDITPGWGWNTAVLIFNRTNVKLQVRVSFADINGNPMAVEYLQNRLGPLMIAQAVGTEASPGVTTRWDLVKATDANGNLTDDPVGGYPVVSIYVPQAEVAALNSPVPVSEEMAYSYPDASSPSGVTSIWFLQTYSYDATEVTNAPVVIPISVSSLLNGRPTLGSGGTGNAAGFSLKNESSVTANVKVYFFDQNNVYLPTPIILQICGGCAYAQMFEPEKLDPTYQQDFWGYMKVESDQPVTPGVSQTKGKAASWICPYANQ